MNRDPRGDCVGCDVPAWGEEGRGERAPAITVSSTPRRQVSGSRLLSRRLSAIRTDRCGDDRRTGARQRPANDRCQIEGVECQLVPQIADHRVDEPCRACESRRPRDHRRRSIRCDRPEADGLDLFSSRKAIRREGNSGQSRRLPPTLITAREAGLFHAGFPSARRFCAVSAAGYRAVVKPFGGQGDDENESTAAAEASSPDFLQPDERAVRTDHAAGQPPARKSPEPGMTAAAGRPMVEPQARSAASTRRSSRLCRRPGRTERRRRPRDLRGRCRPFAPGGRGPPPRRGPAVGRREISRVGLDVAENQIDVKRRSEDLGGQPRRYAPQGSSGASAHTGVRRTPA